MHLKGLSRSLYPGERDMMLLRASLPSAYPGSDVMLENCSFLMKFHFSNTKEPVVGRLSASQGPGCMEKRQFLPFFFWVIQSWLMLRWKCFIDYFPKCIHRKKISRMFHSQITLRTSGNQNSVLGKLLCKPARKALEWFSVTTCISLCSPVFPLA